MRDTWDMRDTRDSPFKSPRSPRLRVVFLRCELLASPWRSTAKRKPPREDFRQARHSDLPLRLFDGVAHAIELDHPGGGFDDPGGGARVAVARLADGPDVHQVARVAVERQA